MPLVSAGRVVGVLSFEHFAPLPEGAFDPHLLILAVTLANLLQLGDWSRSGA